MSLDPDACYRVRDLAFQKEDLKFYLTEGHLIFAKPVEGRRLAAMFTAEIPGGDAEVLLFPPHRSERMSLAQFAKTPNLNEHFTAALFLFTDGTGEQLLEQIEAQEPKKLPEMGTALAATFTETARNLAGSYGIRIVQDRFSASPAETGFFYAAISGKELGNIDLVMDLRQRDQIMVGQVAHRMERRFFDTWTSFPSRSVRTGARKPFVSNARLENIRIDVSLEAPALRMKGSTSMDVLARRGGDRAVSFEVSSRVRITEAKFDGEPVEVFRRESMRVNLNRGNDNEVFLVLLPRPLVEGEVHRLEFAHEGDVVSEAGNGVYFVGSRLNWYPNRDAEFAKYDMTFRHPKQLKLVATGELIEDKTAGEVRTARYTTSSPIRFAGFNLGEYQTMKATRGGVTVEVCANKSIESALQPRRDVVIPAPTLPRSAGRRIETLHLPMPPLSSPSPASRLEQMSSDIGGALEFMAAHFGPPPLRTLSVSPIPGVFGQGFPGLLYLSTLAYLNPADRPMAAQTESQRTFFSELLHAHETAHQWWGNLVTSGHYQDDWLMEALANYSAMLVLEKKKGRRALDTVLDEYRQDLLRITSSDRTIESAGPLIWGARLNYAESGNAWRVIIYEKGSWVIHMLRERLGSENLLRLLGEVVKRKRYSALSTEEFRQMAVEFLPQKSDDPKLENFFDTWVYNTGVPGFRLTWKVQGKSPKVKLQGTVSQTGVSDEFGTSVPVEIQLPGKRTIVRWVKTSDEEESFSVDLPAAPLKVTLDPGNAVLARR